jgi:hypothetical protein
MSYPAYQSDQALLCLRYTIYLAEQQVLIYQIFVFFYLILVLSKYTIHLYVIYMYSTFMQMKTYIVVLVIGT